MMAAIAAASAGGEASLVDLIRAGDRLNQAILNHDEVQQAVRRLRNSGLVAMSDTSFALTEAGGQLAEDANRRRGGLASVDRLLKALGRQPAVDQPPWLLSEAVHAEACRVFVHGS